MAETDVTNIFDTDFKDEVPTWKDVPPSPYEVTRVALLTGPIFQDRKPGCFTSILENRRALQREFYDFGLELKVDEIHGIAALQQLSEEELEKRAAERNETEVLPMLFKRNRLPYWQGVLMIVLASEFRKNAMDKGGVVISQEYLFEQAELYMDERELRDQVAARRRIVHHIRNLAAMDLIEETVLNGTTAWVVKPLLNLLTTNRSIIQFNDQMRERLEDRAGFIERMERDLADETALAD